VDGGEADVDQQDGRVEAVRKRVAFLSHLYIKVIFLPRQARDKHRENTQKKMPFCRRWRLTFTPMAVSCLNSWHSIPYDAFPIIPSKWIHFLREFRPILGLFLPMNGKRIVAPIESQEDTYPLSDLNTLCSSVSSADTWTVLTVCSGTTNDRSIDLPFIHKCDLCIYIYIYKVLHEHWHIEDWIQTRQTMGWKAPKPLPTDPAQPAVANAWVSMHYYYASLLCIIIMHHYALLCIIMHHYALQLPTDTDTAQHSREKTIENVLLLQPFRVKNDETTDC
jgi:hypothetical protein